MSARSADSAPDLSCVVCGSREARVVFVEHGIDILRCVGCGHVYSSYRVPQDYDGYFGAEEITGDQPWWDEAHDGMYRDFAARFLYERSGRLLDVGCGLGFFVRFVSRLTGWSAAGCEMSPNASRYARETLGLDAVHTGRVEEAGYAPGSFDVITLWDVIEHIPDPAPFLETLAGLLADNGLLFLHTPNVRVTMPRARVKHALRGMREGVHYLEAKDHMNNYSPATLRRVLTAAGFDAIEFFHLRPIQSVAGSRSRTLRLLKNGWYHGARALHAATLGRLNLDNLFVAARRAGAGPEHRR